MFETVRATGKVEQGPDRQATLPGKQDHRDDRAGKAAIDFNACGRVKVCGPISTGRGLVGAGCHPDFITTNRCS